MPPLWVNNGGGGGGEREKTKLFFFSGAIAKFPFVINRLCTMSTPKLFGNFVGYSYTKLLVNNNLIPFHLW